MTDRKHHFYHWLVRLVAGGIIVCFNLSAGIAVAATEIKVAVLKGASSCELKISGLYSMKSGSGQTMMTATKRLKNSKVFATPQGIQIGPREYHSSRLHIVPQKDATVYLGSRCFRGKIDIIKEKNNTLTVVNTVPLEDYIRGVLYHEISHHWPIEAIKAQAVAVRTYALYRKKANAALHYDLTNDIYSQVYGGRTSEKYRTNVAVDKTEGQILMYKGQILPAYFHATCAGHTEDASQLWKEDLAPLKGRACPYCKDSPHYRWKRNFRLKDIQDKLNANGYHLGLIKDILIVSRNKSGRIERLLIKTRDGGEATISGKDFRNIVGPNDIRSNNYEIAMKGYYMDLIGHGWGHGVGLCQWGANFMAREGFTFDKILDYYYPGAELVKIPTAGF